MVKKALSTIMAAVIMISCTACNFNTIGLDENEKFDLYMEELVGELVYDESLDINLLFKNPEDFSIEEKLLSLPYTTKQEYYQSDILCKKIIKELESFDSDKLTPERALNQDIILDYFYRSVIENDFFYHDVNYLGSFIGFQAQLPLLLNEYNFNDKNDLDSYFNILRTAEETFVKYALHEQAREEHSVGMSKSIVDKVIEQCDNFTKDEKPFLIDTINQKIMSVSFLTDDEKIQACSENENLLKNDFINAYKALKAELEKLDPVEEDLGLCNLNGGERYYEWLITKEIGVDMSANELYYYLTEKLDSMLEEVNQIISENPEAYNNVATQNFTYTNEDSAENVIKYISEIAGELYPDIGDFTFKITKVPEAMKDNFSPAAYLSGRIDAPPDETEAIYINSEFSDSLFSTLIHEGYPGHMYQNIYRKKTNLPTVMQLLYYPAYTEGWAQYVENNSWKLSVDKTEAHIAALMASMQNTLFSIADIGIHYLFWSRDDFDETMRHYFNLDDENLEYIYYIILETPTNYLRYAVGAMQLQDMYDYAEDELGDQFSPVEFHKVILETGETSFQILWEQIYKYVELSQSGEFENAA